MKLMYERCIIHGPRRKQKVYEIVVKKTQMERNQQGYGMLWYFGTFDMGELLLSLYLEGQGKEVCRILNSVALERAS